MIDIDNWMRELEEEEDIEIKNNEEYQTKLFEEYVLRGSDHQEERRKLNERYLSGEELMGEHGLRKELAAFDMSYFGRAYLPHYFIRKSPHFHEELDEIWSRGVMKGRNPLKEAKVISRLKGSRQVVAAPRGHAKSTNFTFKDSLHAILYAYKHYILILSDSSEQAEGFLDDIKTELEDNANIIMDFGSLKGDKAWRTGVILTKTDIKAEAIGSGKKVRGRRHRNWRPDLIVLDDIENVLLIASKQSSKLHLCHILVYEPFPDLPPKGCQSRLLCCHLLTSHHSLYTLIPQPFRSQVYPFSIRVSMTFGAASYRMIP